MGDIWHATFDLLSASKAGQDIIPVAMSVLVVAGALLIANVDKPWNFSRVERISSGKNWDCVNA